MLAAAAIVSMSMIGAVSAAEPEQGEGDRPCAGGEHAEGERRFPPLAEVVEVDTSSNTIIASILHPNQEDAEEAFILINYTDDTEIVEDGEEASESSISVGDKIHARGERVDSDDYAKVITADSIRLFDENEPKKPNFKRGERGEHGERPERGEEA